MNNREVIDKQFLSLLRLGIGHEAEVPAVIDWSAIYKLAAAQELSAIVFDGVQKLTSRGDLCGGREMSSELKQRWIGSVLGSYEQRYVSYRSRIRTLAEFYNSHGFKLMVLKGYGLSLNYPVPEHRPCGDIDIWAFGRYKEADEALYKELGVKIDNTHHHHTVFSWKGFMVENHYDIVNVHVQKSSAELEKIFKKLAMDDSNSMEIDGQKVYLPVPDFHALFLIRHALSHFAAVKINMRQVLDWAFFVEKHSKEIHWDWFWDVCECFHMTEFVRILNSICIVDLGFDASAFPEGGVLAERDRGALTDNALKNRVLDDIISPEFTEELPHGMLRRVLFKYRRWQANAWKQRLCYPEGRFKTFWKSAWAHLMKPSSI